MRITCPDCGRVYDDARQWTICPEHNPREAGPHSGYCRQHDILGETCYICEAGKEAPNEANQVA